MSVHFRSRSIGAPPKDEPYRPQQTWRTSGGALPHGGATPKIWAVLAAIGIVALSTVGLHLLFH